METSNFLMNDSFTPTSAAIDVLIVDLSFSVGEAEAAKVNDTSTVIVSAVVGTQVGADDGTAVGLLGAGVGGITTLRVSEYVYGVKLIASSPSRTVHSANPWTHTTKFPSPSAQSINLLPVLGNS